MKTILLNLPCLLRLLQAIEKRSLIENVYSIYQFVVIFLCYQRNLIFCYVCHIILKNSFLKNFKHFSDAFFSLFKLTFRIKVSSVKSFLVNRQKYWNSLLLSILYAISKDCKIFTITSLASF